VRWMTWQATSTRPCLPRRVLGPEDDGLPVHDVALRRRAADAGGRVLLQPLEVLRRAAEERGGANTRLSPPGSQGRTAAVTRQTKDEQVLTCSVARPEKQG
jgi:hypothetical protein